MQSPWNAHALVVGIADYQHITPLPLAVRNDAQAIHDLLLDPQRCGYPAANVRLLLDQQATRAGLLDGLAWLAARCDGDSTALIYVSGHGGRREGGPHAGEYLLPVDAAMHPAEALAQTAISSAALAAALRAIPARRLVTILDCCHAAGIGEPKQGSAPLRPGLAEATYAALSAGRGRVILASSRADELSWVLAGGQHSLFTHHLLAGLRGGAPAPGGLIRICDLFGYVQPQVVAERPGQHPVFRAEIEDNFAVALHQGGKAPPPPAPADDTFAYDVFLSYRQQEPDRRWVRKTLLPQLEAAGLRVCIDHRDFRLGAPLVLEMARAVEQSRYTLAVLSPHYLASNFTELESVLAEHLGLEQGQRRLLAVMREQATPRLGMRARLWLDMSDDDELEPNLARLAYELRRPPDD